MNGTRNLPSRRRVNQHAHPELVEAVTVSRFWRLVHVGSDSECWLWSGDTDKEYGIFFYHGKRRPAHELALSFSTGETRPPTFDTCHSCDNPPCCNPAHLRFDTRQSNVADMWDRGRGVKAKKLTPTDILTIRQRRAAGARQKDLATQYNVSSGEISMIVRGLRWPEVGGPIQNKNQYYRKEKAHG